MASDDEEQVLIDACMEGETSAFHQLYDRHVSRVYTLSFRLANNVSDAEEITQEAFAEAWRCLANFRGGSRFSTWLHRLATNVAIDHIRRRKKWWHALATTQQEVAEPCIEDAGKERDLVVHMAQLPQQTRLVFVLFALEGYSHAEIAQLLKIAKGTSKAHYFRAREILRKSLDYE